jgi:hypothetical protein
VHCRDLRGMHRSGSSDALAREGHGTPCPYLKSDADEGWPAALASVDPAPKQVTLAPCTHVELYAARRSSCSTGKCCRARAGQLRNERPGRFPFANGCERPPGCDQVRTARRIQR